jgi:hypothetical protein
LQLLPGKEQNDDGNTTVYCDGEIIDLQIGSGGRKDGKEITGGIACRVEEKRGQETPVRVDEYPCINVRK